MKTYRFTYPDVGISQLKYLVDDDTYFRAKKLSECIADAEDQKNKETLKRLKTELRDLICGVDVGQLFTADFRIYKSIETGIVEPWFDGMKPMTVIAEIV